jgi:hypothetical protein
MYNNKNENRNVQLGTAIAKAEAVRFIIETVQTTVFH